MCSACLTPYRRSDAPAQQPPDFLGLGAVARYGLRVKTCPTDGTLFTGRGKYCSDFCRKAKPCRGCGALKTGQSPFCEACRRDRTPSVELTHSEAWKARQATKDGRPRRKPAHGPEGLWWCAGCREWLSPRWFLLWKDIQKGRAAPPNCRACRSARGHATRLKTEFGMTPEAYIDLLLLQGGGCAICGGKPRSERLAVDHAHAEAGGDGMVRGLLCSKCNNELLTGIRHSARLASRAALYLTAPPARTRKPVPNAVSMTVDDLNALIALIDLTHPAARSLLDRLWLDIGAA